MVRAERQQLVHADARIIKRIREKLMQVYHMSRFDLCGLNDVCRFVPAALVPIAFIPAHKITGLKLSEINSTGSRANLALPEKNGTYPDN
jgi:hypothetical protein